jgi:hypothetical protein
MACKDNFSNDLLMMASDWTVHRTLLLVPSANLDLQHDILTAYSEVLMMTQDYIASLQHQQELPAFLLW